MAKFNFKPVLLATAVAAAALAAQAQNMQNAPAGAPQAPNAPSTTMQQQRQDRAAPGAEQEGTRMQRRVERMQVRVAQRLAALKVKLQLTQAQQGTWGTFEKAVQPTPDELQRMMSVRSEMKNLNTPQRIDRMRSLRSERDAAMDKRFDAVKTFYAQLSPEQQKTFDAAAMRAFNHDGGEEGHGWRHGGGHHDRGGQRHGG